MYKYFRIPESRKSLFENKEKSFNKNSKFLIVLALNEKNKIEDSL